MRMTESEVRKFRASYIEENPTCQYHAATRGHVRVRGASPAPPRSKLCVEHIWNRRSHKSEHWSNFATVGPVMHDWKHSNSVPARVAIMSLKLDLARTTGNWDHFDLDAIRDFAGFRVQGWLESKLPELPDWCQPICRDLMERIDAL